MVLLYLFYFFFKLLGLLIYKQFWKIIFFLYIRSTLCQESVNIFQFKILFTFDEIFSYLTFLISNFIFTIIFSYILFHNILSNLSQLK